MIPAERRRPLNEIIAFSCQSTNMLIDELLKYIESIHIFIYISPFIHSQSTVSPRFEEIQDSAIFIDFI